MEHTNLETCYKIPEPLIEVMKLISVAAVKINDYYEANQEIKDFIFHDFFEIDISLNRSAKLIGKIASSVLIQNIYYENHDLGRNIKIVNQNTTKNG